MPYIFLCVLLLLPRLADALVFDETSQKIPLGTEIMVFEDVSGDATVEDVTSPAMQGRFRPHDVQTLNAGLSTSVFWIRVDLTYQPQQLKGAQPWWLVLTYPPLDDVRLYQVNPQGLVALTEHTGDTLPYSSRMIKRPDYVFELLLEPGQPQTLYLRIETQGVLLAPLTLWSPKAYLEFFPKDAYALGALFGVLLVMTVYNLFIFISVRDISYLYYILYITSFGMYLLTLKGLATELLWPESPDWINVSMPFWISASCLFGAQFVRKFLHMSEHSIWADRFLILFMGVAVTVMVLSVTMDYRLPMILATYLTIIGTATAFCSGLLAWFNGMRVARYFIIAWSALLSGALISALMGVGIVPSNLFTMNASQIGCAIEVSLLSLALADRINALKEEQARVHKESSLKLEGLNRELAASNLLKDQFLSTVTHELRTPMIGVLGSLELMQTVPMDDELAQYHQTAHVSANTMMGMVNNIIHLTELQAGRLYPHREAYSLQGLIYGLRAKYQQHAAARGLQMTVNVDERLPDMLEGDARMVSQALSCLLDNALKFTHQGGVTLSFSLGAGTGSFLPLLIDIEDSGVGFTPAEGAKLYEHFQQLDGSNTRAYGGLGIGLSICRQVLMLMGGEVSHESTPGQGTLFHIVLPNCVPVTRAESTATLRRAGAPVRQAGECRVLLVKSNFANRLLIRGMLLRLGYRVCCAESGEEALEFLRRERVDAVLLDTQMPGMDGYATCRALRLLPGCEMLPVLALTASQQPVERERYIAAGMTDCLEKPVKFEQLRELLDAWVLCQPA
ncbi:7TM diverse intracellular signaling domain-containing protein [Ectopseudomonas mendocina]|uniref:histidine kinase n=1 Tax=Ectopseudomonas mendocina TaxID=300 RepID=A0ABZ2RLN7_ECTME